MSEIRWYVAATSGLREDVAEVNLLRQGFRTFLPRRPSNVARAGKVRIATCAYFPGYIFVSLDLDRDRWRSINGTYGVKSLVSSGGRPNPAPRGLVETLISATDEAGLVTIHPSLSDGAKVRPLYGPFAQMTGMFETMSGRERVTALFQMMNREVRTQMNAAAVVEAAW